MDDRKKKSEEFWKKLNEEPESSGHLKIWEITLYALAAGAGAVLAHLVTQFVTKF